MTRPTPRLTIGVLLVALLTVTAGCAAAIGDDPDPERIADELEERNEQIEDIQGERVQTVETPNSTQRTVVEIAERPPEQSRQEVLETNSDWQSAGDVTVNDGETMSMYDASENTVTEYNVSYEPESAAFASEELIANALNESNVSYEGSDTVADREVHVIELTDTDTDRTTTVWVDTEFWYPLKYETTTERGDQQLSTTMVFEEVAFNEGLDDETFEFEPPADATVEQYEPPETQTVDSLAAVDDETPYDVSAPKLPDRFEFHEGRITDAGDSRSAYLSYTADDERVSFSVTNNTAYEASGETVEIGDREGTLSEYDEMRSLTWDCDGVRYTLSGELDRETLIDSAASVSC
ncbi:DUF2092 domain-containing protein [Halohasta litorea]|uniref:DUF2092 domain-containing protein n=1 Tax=Halohasta litorea TaxID=869891 RepID=A0ABD6D8D9_9EURY|nr:DUF2092 domain-containing protein [Halohasta litorea]